jgi:hypothetical protein
VNQEAGLVPRLLNSVYSILTPGFNPGSGKNTRLPCNDLLPFQGKSLDGMVPRVESHSLSGHGQTGPKAEWAEEFSPAALQQPNTPILQYFSAIPPTTDHPSTPSNPRTAPPNPANVCRKLGPIP